MLPSLLPTMFKQELRVDIARMWNKNTKVVPFAIWASESNPHPLEKHLKNIGINPNITTFQKSAQLGTEHILRRLHSVWG